uniref:Uncharacterized protein n=1 Tax=Arundo donax TaxID=35708 RepID=A0A0A9BC82_ARUDO
MNIGLLPLVSCY